MKIMQELKNKYLPLVQHFIPNRVEEAGEIGYQIEMFCLHAKYENFVCENFRLKEEGDPVSTALYEETQKRGSGEKIDDLFVLTTGQDVYLGFNLRKDS
jgi:hypothetical protein